MADEIENQQPQSGVVGTPVNPLGMPNITTQSQEAMQGSDTWSQLANSGNTLINRSNLDYGSGQYNPNHYDIVNAFQDLKDKVIPSYSEARNYEDNVVRPRNTPQQLYDRFHRNVGGSPFMINENPDEVEQMYQGIEAQNISPHEYVQSHTGDLIDQYKNALSRLRNVENPTYDPEQIVRARLMHAELSRRGIDTDIFNEYHDDGETRRTSEERDAGLKAAQEKENRFMTHLMQQKPSEFHNNFNPTNFRQYNTPRRNEMKKLRIQQDFKEDPLSGLLSAANSGSNLEDELNAMSSADKPTREKLRAQTLAATPPIPADVARPRLAHPPIPANVTPQQRAEIENLRNLFDLHVTGGAGISDNDVDDNMTPDTNRVYIEKLAASSRLAADPVLIAEAHRLINTTPGLQPLNHMQMLELRSGKIDELLHFQRNDLEPDQIQELEQEKREINENLEKFKNQKLQANLIPRNREESINFANNRRYARKRQYERAFNLPFYRLPNRIKLHEEERYNQELAELRRRAPDALIPPPLPRVRPPRVLPRRPAALAPAVPAGAPAGAAVPPPAAPAAVPPPAAPAAVPPPAAPALALAPAPGLPVAPVAPVAPLGAPAPAAVPPAPAAARGADFVMQLRNNPRIDIPNDYTPGTRVQFDRLINQRYIQRVRAARADAGRELTDRELGAIRDIYNREFNDVRARYNITHRGAEIPEIPPAPPAVPAAAPAAPAAAPAALVRSGLFGRLRRRRVAAPVGGVLPAADYHDIFDLID